MAEEFVRTEHFKEFSRRIDERILGVEKRMDQGFAHAEKAREQNLVHINQRFDDMNRRFDDMNRGMNYRFDSLEKRMDFQNRMTLAVSTTVGGGILIGLVKYLFFSG